MHIKKTQITTQTFLVLLIMILVIVGTFNTTFSSLNRVGLLSLLITLGATNVFLLLHLSVSKQITKQHLIIIILSTLFIFVNLIGLFNNFNSRSFITLFQFITLIGFFIFSSLIDWTEYRLKIARNLSIIYIIVNFGYWAISRFHVPFKSFYPNPNLIGIFAFLTAFFIFTTKRKSNLFFGLLILLLMYASGARSVYLSLALALLTYIFWPSISKKKNRYINFILIVIAGVISFTFVYPKLILWDKFYLINNFVREYTNKNLYSGREFIWSSLIDKINEQPFFGYGTGILPNQLIDSGLSAHNFYLQIATQNGYLGLAILLVLFVYIWSLFFRNKESRIVRISASYFSAILIYLTFEVSLTQNQIASGIIMWFIFSVGLSFSLNNYKNDETI